MKTSIFLGVVCLVSRISAQYESGPVPQRPLAFSGASPAQPVRTNIVRQRPVARTLQQEPVHIARSQISPQTDSVVRQRRPQVARSRSNLIQEQNSIPRARISTDAEDVYIRQPVAATLPPLPQTTRYITPRPVVEEEYIDEEEEDTTTPASISRSSYVGPYAPNAAPPQFQRPAPPPIQTPQPQPFQRPAFLQPAAFRPSPQVTIQQQQIQPLPSPQPSIVRQFPRPQPAPLRPAPQVLPVTRPPLPSTPQHNLISSEEEEEEDDDEPQYVRQPVRQLVKRPQPQQQTEQSKQIQSPRQQIIRQPEVAPKAYPSKASTSQKNKKPVVQTVRKFHEENEDGSITWGYENDDGSFKEETIGVDCVTRGKYGYYDPDGVKREYTYQTGIPCDREAEAEQAASSNEGYIDYTSNKYVFPNGDEIDLDAMVKNRARKPVSQYRN